MRNNSSKNPLLACVTLGTAILMVAQGPMGTGAYFSDIENSTANIFQAGTWIDPQSPFNIVLNEFLPDPDMSANGLNFGDDNDSNPLGEWVELYNNGDEPIDVVGWYLADASGGLGNIQAVISGSNTDTGGTVIAAHGWLVVFMNKTTLGNSNAEEIHLFTVDDIEVDFVAYNNPSDYCEFDPTLGTSNPTSTSTASGTPGLGPDADCSQTAVAPNKSYARIPDGTGDWVDPIPTPGAPNILDEESAAAMEPSEEEETASAPELEIEVSDGPFEIIEPATSTPENEVTPMPEGVGGQTDNVDFEVEVSDEPLEIVEPVDEPAPAEEGSEPEIEEASVEEETSEPAPAPVE